MSTCDDDSAYHLVLNVVQMKHVGSFDSRNYISLEVSSAFEVQYAAIGNTSRSSLGQSMHIVHAVNTLQFLEVEILAAESAFV